MYFNFYFYTLLYLYLLYCTVFCNNENNNNTNDDNIQIPDTVLPHLCCIIFMIIKSQANLHARNHLILRALIYAPSQLLCIIHI